MVKKFLLNQKVYRRARSFFGGRTVRRRIIEAAGIVARETGKSFHRVVTNKAFPFAAPGFVLLCVSLALSLYLLSQKNQTLQDKSVDVSEGVGNEETPPPLLGGSGIPLISREQDVEHTVADGETFSEIAYIYNISIEKLALYNRLVDINRIKEGTVIKIPSLAAEGKIAANPTFETKKLVAAGNPAQRSQRSSGGEPAERSVSTIPLKIEAEQQFDGTAVTAHFSVQPPKNVTLTRFEWDLGNGRKSFRQNTFWTYDAPGTYTVTLKAADADGLEYTADEVFIDVPHPTTYQDTLQQFLTLESIEQTFTVYGKVTGVIHYDGLPDDPIVEVSANEDAVKYRATRPGYFGFTAEKDGMVRHFYVFVSPMDSKHSDRTDLNWYRTQFNTGTQSNCGPAVASMAISWATGEYVAVSTVREEIGWTGNGSTSFEDLIRQMKKHGVSARFVSVDSPKDFFDIIDRGNIAIILYNSGGPKLAKGHLGDDFFGRYYYDTVGHYVVVKGYTRDGQYLITYDPIPSDWGSNSFRYPDGISMIGRNRYYGTKELLGSLRRWDVIEIMRDSPQPPVQLSTADLIHGE